MAPSQKSDRSHKNKPRCSDPAMDLLEGLCEPTESLGNIESYRKEARQMLGPALTKIDELVQAGSVPTAILLTILLELELAGLAKRHGGLPDKVETFRRYLNEARVRKNQPKRSLRTSRSIVHNDQI